MWLVDDDPADLIRHHERLQAEIQQLGDPLLFFLSTTTFSSILYETGEVDRARTMVHASIEPSRRAGPIAIMSSLANAAALESLDGDPDAARRLASEALRIARDEGFVPRAIDCVFVAALLAARRHDDEAVAVLLAGAAANDRPNQGYHILPRSCRDRAQAAIDAFPDDLHDARERGSRMTFDELIAFALDTLEP
jgi:hypothetical protein